MKTPLTASSTTDCNEQPLLFQALGPRKVVADFSGGTLSSDGGVLLLRQVDTNLGMTRSLAQCFADFRAQVFVDHSVQELLAQRIYGLALERATAGSLRLLLLKVAAQVRVSVRRVYVQLSSAYPLQALFRLCQQRLMQLVWSSG